jgi:hypothetical protein
VSQPFAAGRKHAGEPWQVAAASSRAAQFDPEAFTLTVACPHCHEPAHVEAA